MNIKLHLICAILATSTLAAVPRSSPHAKTNALLEIVPGTRDLSGIESLPQDSRLILSREELKHKKTKSGTGRHTQKVKPDSNHLSDEEPETGNENAKPDGNTKIIHVDIKKLAKGGKVVDSYTPDFKYKLPDKIPEHGVKMPEGFWQEQGMADEFKNSDSIRKPNRSTAAMLGYGQQIDLGRRIENVPYQWQFSSVTTTGYAKTWAMPQLHPFVLTFKPNILLFNARGRIAQVNGLGAVCSTSDVHWLTVHLPMKDRSDCHKEDACGPAGNYDSCFFLGKFARHLCPGRNLGPTTHLYDRRFLTSDGKIIG